MKKMRTLTSIDKKCFNKGDHINNEELAGLIKHYEGLVEHLSPLRHHFAAALEVAHRRLSKLYEYQWARNSNIFERHTK